jgi:predicted amidohydrolase
MIIDPLGEVLYHKENEEEIFTISFDKNKLNEIRSSFPFLSDADIFNIGHK